MPITVDNKISVIIPNWNGRNSLAECLKSLSVQSQAHQVIVVDNGSTDGSVEFVQSDFFDIDVVRHEKNLGFAGGVNAGIRRAIQNGAEFVALFNNDAIAERNWLENLVEGLYANVNGGISTCKFITMDKQSLDSTGECYTSWGLPYPRGRGERVSDKYDKSLKIFGATGGASLYRVSMLNEIGLFDEDFFAYYEDADMSFRAQLAGWTVHYIPKAIAYHQIGATSSHIKGFTTYQTMKNLPLLAYKNVPRKYLNRVMWRLTLARFLFLCRAVARGQFWPALKGDIMATYLLAKKVGERRRIQQTKKVSDEYIWSIMDHDLPPNAHALRKLRQLHWKLTLKRQA